MSLLCSWWGDHRLTTKCVVTHAERPSCPNHPECVWQSFAYVTYAYHHYVIIVYPCLPVIAIIWHTGRSCLSSADAAHLSAQHIASGAWVLENVATRCNTLQHCPSRFWISNGTIKCSCSPKRNLLGKISVLKTILEEKPILALIEGCKGLTRRVQTLKVQCLAQGIVFQFTCFIDFAMSFMLGTSNETISLDLSRCFSWVRSCPVCRWGKHPTQFVDYGAFDHRNIPELHCHFLRQKIGRTSICFHILFERKRISKAKIPLQKKKSQNHHWNLKPSAFILGFGNTWSVNIPNL